ncbi:hypothetical protein [Heyndrickxia faecalis]
MKTGTGIFRFCITELAGEKPQGKADRQGRFLRCGTGRKNGKWWRI